MEPYNPLRHIHELRISLSKHHMSARSHTASCQATEVPASPSQLVELPNRAQSPCRADSASEVADQMQKKPITAVSSELERSTCSGDIASSGTTMHEGTAAALQCPTLCPKDRMEPLQHAKNNSTDEQQLLAAQPDIKGASMANVSAHATEDWHLLGPQLTSEGPISTTVAAGTSDNRQVLSPQLDSKSCNMVTGALGAPGAGSTHAALPQALPLAGCGSRRMRKLARWAALSAGVVVGAPVAWASGMVAGAVQGGCCAGLGLVGGVKLAVPAVELLCKVAPAASMAAMAVPALRQPAKVLVAGLAAAALGAPLISSAVAGLLGGTGGFAVASAGTMVATMHVAAACADAWVMGASAGACGGPAAAGDEVAAAARAFTASAGGIGSSSSVISDVTSSSAASTAHGQLVGESAAQQARDRTDASGMETGRTFAGAAAAHGALERTASAPVAVWKQVGLSIMAGVCALINRGATLSMLGSLVA